MVQIPNEPLSSTYGVLMIGVLFAVFFQGVLTVQVYQYYQNFPEDPRITKYVVATLWVLDFFHLILISYSVYHYLVTIWGNAEGLGYFILPLRLHLVPIAFSSLFSQLFLLYRIWIFSQRKVWLVGLVFMSSLGTFAVIFIAGVLFVTRIEFPLNMVVIVVIETVSDTLIALLLCYFLFKRSEEIREMRVTSILVNQVIRYTLATSALTSLLNVAALIMWFTLPNTFVFIALNFTSGRAYANAVLANLNVRRQIRQSLNRITPSFGKSIEFNRSLGAVRRTSRFNASTSEPTVTPRSSARGNGLEPCVQVPMDTYPPRFRHSLP